MILKSRQDVLSLLLVEGLLCIQVSNVFVGIVSEIEMLRWFDDAAHPLAEILEIDYPFSVSISVDDQCFKISIVETFAELSYDILGCNESIVVLIEV